jgi:hypothetical protein
LSPLAVDSEEFGIFGASLRLGVETATMRDL